MFLTLSTELVPLSMLQCTRLRSVAAQQAASQAGLRLEKRVTLTRSPGSAYQGPWAQMMSQRKDRPFDWRRKQLSAGTIIAWCKARGSFAHGATYIRNIEASFADMNCCRILPQMCSRKGMHQWIYPPPQASALADQARWTWIGPSRLAQFLIGSRCP